MLPTLIFILWAYGMYALISALAGRKTVADSGLAARGGVMVGSA